MASASLGDYAVETNHGVVINRTSDGTGSAGDAVTLSSSKVSQYTSDGDDFYGVLTEDSPSDGNTVSVLIHGDVVVNAGGSITEGDSVELDGGTNGRVTQNTQGTEIDVDEGGTATYTIPFSTGIALTDSGGSLSDGTSLGSNEAVIWVSK